MPIVAITSLQQPGIELFSSLTEAQLRQTVEPGRGIFIAESPKVIRVALQAGYEPVALLCEERHIGGDAADIVARCKDLPVYTGPRELLASLTGYTLTRGVLCALGIDGVLLTRTSCDPLNRRAVRVSMGSVFLVPWTWLDEPLPALHAYGFRTAAMALTDDSLPLDHPALKAADRLAIVMGTEGDGLPAATIAAADYVVRIPMFHEVDSLNVAAAAAVAFWELRVRRP